MTPEERWPPDGIYDGLRCACPETCPHDCHGECGCEACSNAYADYLSSPEP